MKKLRCKKQYGVWFYKKELPNCYNDIDAPIYNLYDELKMFVGTFYNYYEMKNAIEYGDIEEYLKLHG